MSLVERIVEELASLAAQGYFIGSGDIQAAIRIISQDSHAHLFDVYQRFKKPRIKRGKLKSLGYKSNTLRL